MQINRLFEIVYLLMHKKKMTADELATHFEVSKRTILRDIDTLSAAGIPVYTMQGKGGGIFLHDRFVLNKTVLSETDQQQILFALQGMSATQHIETKGILSRLRSLFDQAGKDWIEVDFSRWGNQASDRSKFDLLKNAVMHERAITFTYYSANGETTKRTAYPLKLVFKSTAWYLQAYCLLRNDFRLFKITRMMHVVLLDDTFDGKAYPVPEMEPSEYPLTELVEVKLHFDAQVAYRVYDEFLEEDMTKNDDGSFTVSMRIPNDYWLYDYILSFGSMVEVIEPQSVRAEIIRQAEQIMKKYTPKA